MIKIVESWENPKTAGMMKNMTVYSDAASAELFVNGVSHGVQQLPTQKSGGDGGGKVPSHL